LIVSDNSQEISLLKDILERIDEVQVVGDLNNSLDAVNTAKELQPDIAFFDLDMSGGT